LDQGSIPTRDSSRAIRKKQLLWLPEWTFGVLGPSGMKHGRHSKWKAQLMGVDWTYDREHRVQLLRDNALSWLASDREREKQQG